MVRLTPRTVRRGAFRNSSGVIAAGPSRLTDTLTRRSANPALRTCRACSWTSPSTCPHAYGSTTTTNLCRPPIHDRRSIMRATAMDDDSPKEVQ